MFNFSNRFFSTSPSNTKCDTKHYIDENHPCMMTPCMLGHIHRHTSFSIRIVTFSLMLFFFRFQQNIWEKKQRQRVYTSIDTFHSRIFIDTRTHTDTLSNFTHNYLLLLTAIVVVIFYSVNINLAEIWVPCDTSNVLQLIEFGRFLEKPMHIRAHEKKHHETQRILRSFFDQ